MRKYAREHTNTPNEFTEEEEEKKNRILRYIRSVLKSESNVVRMFWIKFRFGPSDYKWLDTNRETNENEGGSFIFELTATVLFCEKIIFQCVCKYVLCIQTLFHVFSSFAACIVSYSFINLSKFLNDFISFFCFSTQR